MQFVKITMNKILGITDEHPEPIPLDEKMEGIEKQIAEITG